MQKPTRLFDCLEYQLERYPLDTMLSAKEGGQWKSYSTAETQLLVNKFSAGLQAMGIGGGDYSLEGRDKIAVLSRNRPEWMLLDIAVQQVGAVLVPVYPTINVNELQFILNDAQVKMVFVNDQELYHKIQSIRPNTPTVKEVFTFEHVPNAKYWKDILVEVDDQKLSMIKAASSKIGYEDLATIIYTSGTTGTPKGVMLSHKNILSNVMDTIECFDEIGVRGEKALSFLPLNHIFERMVTYIYLFNGVKVYYAESLDTVGDNLREVKPALFTTVPRLLEKVYERIMAKGAEQKGIRKKLFYWAIELGLINGAQRLVVM
jgi:long-chain acyl-CoA synthetase